MEKLKELAEILSFTIGRPIRVISVYNRYQIVAPIGGRGGFMPISPLLSKGEAIVTLQTMISMQIRLKNTEEE